MCWKSRLYLNKSMRSSVKNNCWSRRLKTKMIRNLTTIMSFKTTLFGRLIIISNTLTSIESNPRLSILNPWILLEWLRTRGIWRFSQNWIKRAILKLSRQTCWSERQLLSLRIQTQILISRRGRFLEWGGHSWKTQSAWALQTLQIIRKNQISSKTTCEIQYPLSKRICSRKTRMPFRI